MSKTILKMGMVGGGRDAFIGTVHRTAACLDGRVRFVAGALSSTPEKALASGRDLGLENDRNYPTWRKMLEGEMGRQPGDRIDFVSVVTPNDTHFEVAHAFVSAGINVICDKPLVHTSQQANQLIEATRASGAVFAVTYNYSGYPMVKQARHMVRQGQLGAIRKIIVEYNQGWLATKLEESGQKQADWRTNPARSGLGGAIGDIGSHAEQLVSYITGLEIESICADLTTFVPGRRLDDDANLLLRFVERNGVSARGILTASQISVGCENDLRIRIFGEKGALHWRQEDPNHLVYHPLGEPERILRRGNDYLCAEARANTRIPSGHPEAFLEAFANVYNAAGEHIRARNAGEQRLADEFDYPTLIDGARGVRFIEKTVESATSEQKWTAFGEPVWSMD